jgi:hypothetical protein
VSLQAWPKYLPCRVARAAFLIGLFSIGASTGEAQGVSEDPVATARVHLGPVGVNPKVLLVNAGIDNNVFNDHTSPKRDFTFTVEPNLGVFLRTRNGLLSLNGRLDLVYFNTYATERSVNGFSEATYEYRFNRIRPFASFSALDAKERPGYEIDTRARRFDNTLRTGVDVRVAPKTNLQVGVSRHTVAFAEDAFFSNQSLREVLNRTLWAVDADWRQRLTPLTTLVVSGSREQERFAFAPIRDSNTLRVNGGLELGRFALIRGTALVGYRQLKPVKAGTLREFSGLTSNVNVSYTAPTQTRLSVTIARDIQYSFDIGDPYYVQTGWNIGLTQRIIGRWEGRVSGGQDHLAYSAVSPTTLARRSDRIDRIGAGVGYELNGEVTAGFMVESYFRTSTLPGLRYQTIRSFGSVNYGF